MPRCLECGKNVRAPDEFYYCPTCGDSLCSECRMTHTHAD